MTMDTRLAPRRTTSSRLVSGVLLGAALALSACGQTNGPTGSPDEVLAAAQAELDATTGVHVTVACAELPEEVSGLVGADGVLTSAPAFEGTVELRYGGVTAEIPVVSVDDTVWAQLPFTTGFAPIDPAEYGAPDPARLLTPGAGISRWLATASGVEEGDPVRDGHDVLTPYSGSLEGEVVADVIPGADADATFEVVFTITEDGLLHEAEVSGPFYEDEQEVTYVVGLDDYGTEKAIHEP